MHEKTPEAKLPLSTREYIAYKSAMQDFALACRYSLDVLYGNSLRAETSKRNLLIANSTRLQPITFSVL